MSRSIVVAVVVSALFLFSGVVVADNMLGGRYCSKEKKSNIVLSSSGKLIWTTKNGKVKGTYESNKTGGELHGTWGDIEIELEDGDLFIGSWYHSSGGAYISVYSEIDIDGVKYSTQTCD